KLNWLIALVVVGGLMYLWNRNSVSGITGPSTVSAGFQPLNVQDPQLRLDMLDKIRKLEYSGAHRNIFSATPLPPPAAVAEAAAAAARRNQGPVLPPPPPPPSVPATFFGFVSNPTGANRLGFFQAGDDVYVVGEGSLLLTNFRLLKIGNDTAEFEEVSTGRKASLAITQPAAGSAAAGAIAGAGKDSAGQGDPEPPPQ
ncbi:MAG: hypothetical protein WB795_14555, partial [Candidatus Acidiferrales bacterium]